MKTNIHFYHIPFFPSYKKNVVDKRCTENHIMCAVTFFFGGGGGCENCPIFERVGGAGGGSKIVPFMRECGRPRMTIWRMRIACWIPKATNTHSGCVILIVFPPQQWLHERATLLRFTYIDRLV
jgi:hypothetical protein